MSIDKKISYVEQDGSLNFIKNSESVTVPKRFKARKNAPATKLAYITDAEAKMLKKMKKGTPHKGPKGIPSYDSFGSIDASGRDTGRAGSEVSAAETGNFSGFDGSPSVELPPGVTPKGSKEAQDLRSAAIAAGAGQRVNPGFFDSRDVISPQELARARAFAKDRSNRFAKGAMRKTRGGGLMGFLTGGGFLGNIIRSLGQRFGLGKTFDQPTYDMSGLSGLPLGGSAAFANLDIRDKFDRRGDLIEEDDEEDIIGAATPNELANELEALNEGTDFGLGPLEGAKDGGRIGYLRGGLTDLVDIYD